MGIFHFSKDSKPQSFQVYLSRFRKCNLHFAKGLLKFPASGLNTEIYFVNLRIQPACGKMWTRKTPNTNTFDALLLSLFKSLALFFLRNVNLSLHGDFTVFICDFQRKWLWKAAFRNLKIFKLKIFYTWCMKHTVKKPASLLYG